MAYRCHERLPIHAHVQRTLAVQHRLVLSVGCVLVGEGVGARGGLLGGGGPFECGEGDVGSTHTGRAEHFETVV